MFRLEPHAAVGGRVIGHNWEIMQSDAPALHEPCDVRRARVTVKPSLEALHGVRSFGCAF